MRQVAPPLQGIEAFIVAARSSSFRAAADALALSPSAFSRRIQALEAFVGAVLFDRSAPTLTLTPAGAAYRTDIEPAIDVIRNATRRLRTPRHRSLLRVMASQSFAISWLMPRLPSFREAHAESHVEIVLGRDLTALRIGKADIAVAYGPSDFGGLPFERLIELEGTIVTAPVLACGRPPPRSAEELSEHHFLGVQTPRDLWPRWLARAGLAEPSFSEPIYFETLTLMYEAAANGLGVALAVPTVADRYLQEGRLRPCFDLRAPVDADYNLVYASELVRQRPEIRAFARWMKIEADSSGTNFAMLTSARFKSGVERLPAPH